MRVLGARQYTLLKHLQKEKAEVSDGWLTSSDFTSVPIRSQSVHRVLMNLAKRDLVDTKMGDPTHKRGGKARRLFAINEIGEQAIQSFESETNRY